MAYITIRWACYNWGEIITISPYKNGVGEAPTYNWLGCWPTVHIPSNLTWVHELPELPVWKNSLRWRYIWVKKNVPSGGWTFRWIKKNAGWWMWKLFCSVWVKPRESMYIYVWYICERSKSTIHVGNTMQGSYGQWVKDVKMVQMWTDGFGALTDLDLAVSSLTHPGLVLNDPGDELKQPYFHSENQWTNMIEDEFFIYNIKVVNIFSKWARRVQSKCWEGFSGFLMVFFLSSMELGMWAVSSD